MTEIGETIGIVIFDEDAVLRVADSLKRHGDVGNVLVSGILVKLKENEALATLGNELLLFVSVLAITNREKIFGLTAFSPVPRDTRSIMKATTKQTVGMS